MRPQRLKILLPGKGGPSVDGPLYFILFQKDKAVSLYGRIREHGSDILNINTTKTGTFHIYAAFVAHDRTRQSESVYLGMVEIR